ncbi:MAG: glycogen synthase GlgA [Calditrichaeota bacterium]|nr:glycogen synthase GlgA [Calditrichota bacterium]
MNNFKICYVASEVSPFVKTGGLGDVASALPVALKELEQDIRLMMPKYRPINERKFVLRDVIRLREVKVPLGGLTRIASGKTAFLPQSKVHVYFLFIPELFDRKGIYADPETGQDYPDNAERFAYFSKAVLETLKLLYWQPDIIHCNEWQTALIPFYLKTYYQDDEFFQNTRTVLTVHNLSYQGRFPLEVAPRLDIPEELVAPGGPFEFQGELNLLKGGILYADVINTVSERYAEEIVSDPEYGFGFENILASRKKDLYGILNGVDYSVWNPETDKYIPVKYDSKTLEKKSGNKKVLCDQNGFAFSEDIPLLGMVTRLIEQKGIELVLEAMDELMKRNLYMIILGTGEEKYQKALEKFARKYKKKLAVHFKFDERLAHLIEAGADMFLMPSKFEPCGLNQMYSLRYGTVPIVRETGGLADTVKDFDPETGKGNGFTFKEFSAAAMLEAIDRALAIYPDRKTWTKIQKAGMRADFSWQVSAKKYLKLYEKALKKK